MGRPGSPQFTAQSARRNGVARIALQGELDLASVPALLEHLEMFNGGASGNGDGHPHVILDLRGLTFLDPSGLQVILDAARSASERGLRFAAVGVSDPIRRLFEITGTLDSLNQAGAVELIQRFTRPDGEAS
jgi:anti-anti-sigma factor